MNEFPAFDEHVSVGEVEPNRQEFILNEHEPYKESIDIISFEIPDTIEKARSAYCYDPVFNTAVDIFASRENKRVEEVLSENLMHALHCRAELITGEARRSRKGAVSARNFSNFFDKEPAEDHEDTVESLREKYVEGEIDIYEFEERVENVLEEEYET